MGPACAVYGDIGPPRDVITAERLAYLAAR